MKEKKQKMSLEEENRLIQEQNLEILRKLGNLESTISQLIKKLFQEVVMDQLQVALDQSKEAKETCREILEILTAALEEWELQPDQKRLLDLAAALQASEPNSSN